jgi:hypothetical protein
MNVDEVTPVLDVHPPHEPIHGWRDFFLHLATITIGLLIALGLEGCVEWMHHRHLVHEAQAALRDEISGNEGRLAGILASVDDQGNKLKHDVAVLNKRVAHPLEKNDDSMSIDIKIVGFDNVSWKTAQSTGALTYMPYAQVQEYAEIYDLQEELDVVQKQAARDAALSVGRFMDDDAPIPASRVADDQMEIQRIVMVQGQLYFYESLIKGLDDSYKKFLTAHPE